MLTAPLVRPKGLRRRSLHAPLERIIRDLSTDHGKCWSSEAGLRRELARRTGYICGERSIGRVIKRAVAAGLWGHERVKPNRAMANGQVTVIGTQHNWVLTRSEQRKTRRQQHELARQARHRAARLEREQLEAEQRAREEAARDRAHRAPPNARSLLNELLAPKAPAAIPVPLPAAAALPGEAFAPIPDDARAQLAQVGRSFEPPAGDALAEQRRAEVARQLAALRDAGLLPGDDPPHD
ncbi:MAG: hypothetical protein JOZ69_07465 [Myxococcales bacterium]|nr:hypothetical protein [Myxococcales bacterium]